MTESEAWVQLNFAWGEARGVSKHVHSFSLTGHVLWSVAQGLKNSIEQLEDVQETFNFRFASFKILGEYGDMEEWGIGGSISVAGGGAFLL